MINAVSRVYRSFSRRVGGVAAAAIDAVKMCAYRSEQKSPRARYRRLTKPLVCKLVSYMPLAFRALERRLVL